MRRCGVCGPAGLPHAAECLGAPGRSGGGAWGLWRPPLKGQRSQKSPNHRDEIIYFGGSVCPIVRSYLHQFTRSHQIPEVKCGWVRLVLSSVTRWELLMSHGFLLLALLASPALAPCVACFRKLVAFGLPSHLASAFLPPGPRTQPSVSLLVCAVSVSCFRASERVAVRGGGRTGSWPSAQGTGHTLLSYPTATINRAGPVERGVPDHRTAPQKCHKSALPAASALRGDAAGVPAERRGRRAAQPGARRARGAVARCRYAGQGAGPLTLSRWFFLFVGRVSPAWGDTRQPEPRVEVSCL